MIVDVDTSSPTPPYEQLRAQIARMIDSGVLGAHSRLPTIAQLANDLGLAPGTVARAYRELDADGLVVSRRRVGTVVADRPPRHHRKRDTGALDAAVRDFARQLHQLGAGPDEAIPRLRALWSSRDW